MKQRKLNFRYNIGDAILLSDGRRGIITRYGIYDDQYWCEIADAHGINLCFADWFFCSWMRPYNNAAPSLRRCRISGPTAQICYRGKR